MSADALVHAVRPPREGAPVLLLLHGRGGDHADLLPVADAVAPGWGVLAPRGPVPQPPGWAWFLNRAIGVPVEEDFDRRRDEVAGWLEDALATYAMRAPVVALGFSNGGMMAGALAAARPDLVAAVALLSSAYPLSAARYAEGGLRDTPVFASGGDADPFHPPEVMRAGVDAYRAAGARVEELQEPGAGHGVTPLQAEALRRWLGAWVAG
ncbi:MAG TPA: alpha/beta fold hydrolase [Miltoncostaeaceae bacterium]|nr:alpha/beta fold hydrolase [Miltoncostaeaceae bacterium]